MILLGTVDVTKGRKIVNALNSLTNHRPFFLVDQMKIYCNKQMWERLNKTEERYWVDFIRLSCDLINLCNGWECPQNISEK